MDVNVIAASAAPGQAEQRASAIIAAYRQRLSDATIEAYWQLHRLGLEDARIAELLSLAEPTPTPGKATSGTAAA